MKALEELKHQFIEEVITYYKSDKTLSITKCAEKFNISRDTLAKYLKEDDPDNYIHKYNVDENFFEKIDTEEKAYWLGFMTADGCIFKDKPSIRLMLSIKDKEHVEKFKKALRADHSLSIAPSGGYVGKDGTRSMACGITIGNKKLYNDLKKLGFTSRKSLHEKPVILPDNLINHYIRGLFDGDGWLSFGKNYRDLGFGMGYEILEYIKKCAEKFADVKKDYKVMKFKNIYRYRISSKEEILKFLNFMYKNATVYLNRKYQKYLDFIKYCRPEMSSQKSLDD